jgi:hypothetical protein
LFMRFVAIVVLFFCPISVFAQTASFPHELQGFLLGQRRQSIERTLGKPIDIRTSPDGWVDVAFNFKGLKDNYVVFSFIKSGNEPAVAIQFTGKPAPGTRPFLGLRLGDPVASVIANVGKPSSTKVSEEDGTSQYDYAGRSYSFEINSAKKLSSIRISDIHKKPNEFPSLAPLSKAVLNCNVENLLPLLSGDFEGYRGKESWMFEHAAFDDLSVPGKIRELLCGGSNSLNAAFLAGDAAKADLTLRVTEKGPSGPVLKFPGSKIVDEIFFKQEAGEWRVYEIQFR